MLKFSNAKSKLDNFVKEFCNDLFDIEERKLTNSAIIQRFFMNAFKDGFLEDDFPYNDYEKQFEGNWARFIVHIQLCIERFIKDTQKQYSIGNYTEEQKGTFSTRVKTVQECSRKKDSLWLQ